MPDAYPDNSDLDAFLVAAGFTIGADLQAQLDGAVQAARRDLEGPQGWDRVLLAGSAETRYFNPPTNRNGTLLLEESGGGGDLAALTSVAYAPGGTLSETFTAGPGGDYLAEPVNALATGQPITRLRFLRRRWAQDLSPSLYSSIVITGRWGYATTLPDDAYNAILARASWSLYPQLVQSVTGGLSSWRGKDGTSETYGELKPFAHLLIGWGGGKSDNGYGGLVGSAVANYRKW